MEEGMLNRYIKIKLTDEKKEQRANVSEIKQIVVNFIC